MSTRYDHLNPSLVQRSSIILQPHLKDQDLEIVDRLIEPQTIAHFLQFCVEGPLPNGKETQLARLAGEEVQVAVVPRDDGQPIIERVMERVGSMEDGDRLCLVGKNIQSIKSRLWEGMVPLCEERWQEKGLDRPENFEIASQHLSAVLAVFHYLNQPRVIRNLRDTFNLIWDHWAELDTVLNEGRASRGEERVSVATLWTEFIAAHYETVTERAHRWVILQVNALQAPLLQSLASHRPTREDVVDHIQWNITDNLQILAEIAAVADYGIMLPMHGYKGYTAPPLRPNIPPELQSPVLTDRQKAYTTRLKQVSRQIIYRRVAEGRSTGSGVASPESLCQTGSDQTEAQWLVRLETRGEPLSTMPKEPWIMQELYMTENSPSHSSRGLAIYKLTYQQSEAEWAAFVKKVEAHVSNWGRGQTGSGQLKGHLKLHWLDGQALNVPEGDVEAAKQQFTSDALASFDPNDHVNDRVFLVADHASFASYMGDTYSAATDLLLAGDFTGFVLAVDADYDPEEGCGRPNESPGYHGQMRILGSLVWGDLYGMLSSQSALLEDLWPLVLDHPNQVYVGPTVPRQIHDWRAHNGVRNLLLRQTVEYVLAKMNGTAPPLPIPSASQPDTSRVAGEDERPTVSGSVPQNNTHGADDDEIPSPPEGIRGPEADFMRTVMMQSFTAWLRQRNRPQEAILAEETMLSGPNSAPDVARVRQRIDALEAGDETETTRAQDTDDDPCPMQ
ncbi:hypothetical protein P168DRAFT_263040 [Aspergillus campestris IBT 28561]|uniref:Uncharacterized protein n=1 Tax=Aspergillus campestris (strain IBT 28561) TaxID=1392248 RepID=A0A2I1DFJ9_ASPC2|nr:uncharacterized protein P168DRAFT_263040 [Aspergillus campestris IBT 28561]PKY08655.1 hypothetical protein P168DRAFT_263040 [Aspergillus campestris IBT 28561]